MKTANEQFVLARLKNRAQFFNELAVVAGETARLASDAYASFKGDADGLQSFFEKMNALAELQGEAERLAYNAERAAFYAEAGPSEQSSFYANL